MSDEGPEIERVRSQIEQAGWRTWWEREDSFFGDIRWQLIAEKRGGGHTLGEQAKVFSEEMKELSNQEELSGLCRGRVLEGWSKILNSVSRTAGKKAEGVRE